MTAVADVVALLAGGDAHAARAALPPLLALWRAHPTPRLAALVEAVSDQAEQGLAVIAGDTIADKVAAATAVIAAGDPVDLPRLLRLLPDVRIGDAVTLVEGLAAYLPDPRYLRELVVLVRAQRWGMATGRRIWKALFRLPHGDPRIEATLAAIDFTTVAGTAYGATTLAGMAAVARRKAAKELAGRAPAIDPPGLEAIERLVATTTRDGDALLAAIYDNPADLAARTVYADWLTERGDPRGELITIQLAGDTATDEQRRRARVLLDERIDEWLGPIAGPMGHTDSVRFANGFVVAACVHLDRMRATRAARAWGTLEEVAFVLDAAPAADALPVRSSLRAITMLQPGHAAALAQVPHALACLGFFFPHGEGIRDGERMFVESIDRPSVTEAQFYGDANPPPRFAWLWATRLGAQLARLRIVCRMPAMAPWFGAPADVPARVTSLQLSSDGGYRGWTVELTRGTDGAFSRAAFSLAPGARASELVALIAALPADALEAFALRLDGGNASKADVAAIADALVGQTRLVSHRLPGDAPLKKQPAKAAKRVKPVLPALADALARLPAVPPALAAIDFERDDLSSTAGTFLRALAEQGVEIAAYRDACWAILGLPIGDGGNAVTNANWVREGAVAVLAALPPVAGAFARAAAVLEVRSHPLCKNLRCIPTAELPQLFDWFETRRGGSRPPPAADLAAAVCEVAVVRGDATTLADLRARVANKHARPVAWAFETALDRLAKR